MAGCTPDFIATFRRFESLSLCFICLIANISASNVINVAFEYTLYTDSLYNLTSITQPDKPTALKEKRNENQTLNEAQDLRGVRVRNTQRRSIRATIKADRPNGDDRLRRHRSQLGAVLHEGGHLFRLRCGGNKMNTLTKLQLRKMGSWDKGGRYTLNAEYETPTSQNIRTPSRAWPRSIWTHCHTQKFYNSLSVAQLESLNLGETK